LLVRKQKLSSGLYINEGLLYTPETSQQIKIPRLRLTSTHSKSTTSKQIIQTQPLYLPKPKPTQKPPNLNLSNLRIIVHLVMLASSNHRPVPVGAAHGAPEVDEAPPDLDDLAVDHDLGSRGDGAKVGRVERPAHAQVGPVARARDQGQAARGREVEDACCTAAVWLEKKGWVGLVLAICSSCRIGWYKYIRRFCRPLQCCGCTVKVKVTEGWGTSGDETECTWRWGKRSLVHSWGLLVASLTGFLG
jgi:hypothetical protein